MQQNWSVEKEIPIEKIHMDTDQPRQDYGPVTDKNRMVITIKEFGIMDKIKVMEQEDGYLIIDGHHRYLCAKELGYKTMRCDVDPKMSRGELELRRYIIQNVRRDWKPIERSQAFHRMKEDLGYKTNRELAQRLQISETVVSGIIKLKDLQIKYLTRMMEYSLNGSYQSEFVRLYPKLRKIQDFEVDEIITNIFDRVKHQVIKSSKDFRRLGRVFKRAAANEKELNAFLKDADMTVSELIGRTEQSGFSGLATQLLNQIIQRREDGQAESTKEKAILDKLEKVLQERK